MEFSALLSVYKAERASYFNDALISIWDNQTVKPTQIVIVIDGEITDSLQAILDKWKLKLSDTIKLIPFQTNKGLGKALSEGLTHCDHELIARMDTDDIAVPERFSIQLKAFEENPNLSVLGGQVEEFNVSSDNIQRYKHVPTSSKEIYSYSKLRNPINHPTVMFKKSDVLRVGNYRTRKSFEDYDLWIRLLASDCVFSNLDNTLVLMRYSDEQISRRGGASYMKAEIGFQLWLLKIGYISPIEFLRNFILRAPLRIIPSKLLSKVYSLLRNSKK